MSKKNINETIITKTIIEQQKNNNAEEWIVLNDLFSKLTDKKLSIKNRWKPRSIKRLKTTLKQIQLYMIGDDDLGFQSNFEILNTDFLLNNQKLIGKKLFDKFECKSADILKAIIMVLLFKKVDLRKIKTILTELKKCYPDYKNFVQKYKRIFK